MRLPLWLPWVIRTYIGIDTLIKQNQPSVSNDCEMKKKTERKQFHEHNFFTIRCVLLFITNFYKFIFQTEARYSYLQ